MFWTIWEELSIDPFMLIWSSLKNFPFEISILSIFDVQTLIEDFHRIRFWLRTEIGTLYANAY